MIVASTRLSAKNEPKITRHTKNSIAKNSICESIKLCIKMLQPSSVTVVNIDMIPYDTLLKLRTSKNTLEFLSDPSKNKGASALIPYSIAEPHLNT